MYEVNKGEIINEQYSNEMCWELVLFRRNHFGHCPTPVLQTTATVVSTAARLNAFADVYVNISKARSERARTLCMCVL